MKWERIARAIVMHLPNVHIHGCGPHPIHGFYAHRLWSMQRVLARNERLPNRALK